jgi:hypothetical protein
MGIDYLQILYLNHLRITPISLFYVEQKRATGKSTFLKVAQKVHFFRGPYDFSN